MAVVTLPANMQRQFSGRARVNVQGRSLFEVFNELDALSPGFIDRILAPNRSLRPFVRLYIDGAPVRRTDLGEIRLEAKTNIRLLLGLAGG